MFDPFFPGVSRQRSSSASVTPSAKTVGGKMLFDQPLNLMAVLQQMCSINSQLACQVSSRHSLGHPAQNQDDRGATLAGLTPNRIRKHIVHYRTFFRTTSCNRVG
jgi:hypothetical protein